MNETSKPIRWWIPIVAIVAAWALAALSCVPRVRTRGLDRPVASVLMDGAIIARLVGEYRLSYPDENSFCLRGNISDTTINGKPWVAIHVTGVTPALIDSVSPTHVYYAGIPGGCAGKTLVGLSHDHPNLTGICTHSTDDVRQLDYNFQALFSMVFCADGRVETLYRDGRRYIDSWLPRQ